LKSNKASATGPFLAVTDFDLGADIITGTATLTDTVEVCANVPDDCVWRLATPGAGNWVVDYSGEFDLVLGSDGSAAQRDANGNTTWVDWRVPNPYFDVRPIEDRIEGYEWPVGETLTLDINAGVFTTTGVVEVAGEAPG